jgi:hypothetical protein
MGYEWYTLDDQLRRDALIEDFESFIWTERYSAFGDFQIVTKTTYNARQQLVPDTLMGMKGSDRIMQIKTVSDDTDDQGARKLTVTGKSIEAWLDDRVAFGVIGGTGNNPGWTVTGRPADVIRSMFNLICVQCILDPNDTISYYVNGTISQPGDIPEPDSSITVVAQPDTLYNTIKQVADTYGIGFRFVKNQDLGQIYFEVYMGSDRTTGQENNTPIIFDQQLDNLVKPSYLTSTELIKTVAYVIASNGAVVVYATDADPDASGSDRRVLLVNSSNDTPATAVPGFVTDTTAAHNCFVLNPVTTADVLGVPTSFITGNDPKTNPDQDGVGATPMLGYRAYAQFKADIQNSNYVQDSITYTPNGPIDTSIFQWVRYDIEDWVDTPDVESADAKTYLANFIQLAHDNGFKVMVTPARDLGNSDTVHPKSAGEALNDWYVRVNVASWCADADIYEFQDQANMPVAADFKSYFTQVHDQIREVNPDIPVWCGISTTYGDGEVMFDSMKSVIDIADGFWINIIDDTTNGVDFMNRWLAYLETIDTGLIAALEQEGQLALSAQRTVYSFDGELPPSVSFRYGTDYKLGDLVEERTEDGFKNQMMVTEQIFTSDDTGDRAYPTLSLVQTITPGTWLAEPAIEHWDDVDASEHWDDL